MAWDPVAWVNGKSEVLPADSRRLIDWLREDLGLVGTKEPCGTGECGGCSVLVDEQVRLSCTILAASTKSKSVVTIEGLNSDRAQRLFSHFVACGGVQCGYCTPAMVVTAHALLADRSRRLDGRRLTAKMVREALDGNLCRCTGYDGIVKAVILCAEEEGLI